MFPEFVEPMVPSLALLDQKNTTAIWFSSSYAAEKERNLKSGSTAWSL
jgi:hypothetical protein